MNRLRNEIKDIKKTLNAFERGLVMCHADINEGERNQEWLEQRLSANEYHEERLARLEEYMDVIHKNLNKIISRVNDIHVYLRKRDLQCYEEMEASDDEKQ